MAVITRAQIQDELLPVLWAVKGEYDMQPQQWKDIYMERPSTLSVERITQMQYTGLATTKAESMPTNQDPGMRQKYITEFPNQAYGISVIMSREAIDDNQYKKDFPQFAKNLKESLATTKNTVAGLYIYDGATRIMPDGVAQFAVNHPYEGGTFSNLLNTSLNETSAQAALILANNMRDESGKQIVVDLEKLIVPPQYIFAAERLCKSVYSPDTANNAINPVYSLGLFPKGYSKNNFINVTNTATPSWYAKTNVPGFILFQRIKPEFTIVTDEIGTTDNVIAKCYERYCFGCYDAPRSMIGSIL